MIGHMEMQDQDQELEQYRDLDHFDILSKQQELATEQESTEAVQDSGEKLNREKKARNHYIDEMIRRKAEAKGDENQSATEENRQKVFLGMEKLKTCLDELRSPEVKLTDKSALEKKLRTAIGLCDGVFAYGLKKLPVTDEGFFRSNTVVVQSMMAMAAQTLEEIAANQGQAQGEEAVLAGQIQTAADDMARAMNAGKLRIYEEAENSYQAKENVDWFTLMQRAGMEEEISVDSGNTTGGAQSEVFVVKRGEQKAFIKKNEMRVVQEEGIKKAFDSIKTKKAKEAVKGLVGDSLNDVLEQINKMRRTGAADLNLVSMQNFLYAQNTISYDKKDRFLEMQIANYLIDCYKARLGSALADQIAVKKGENMTNRNIATVKMAQLLGLEHLVVDTKNIVVKDGAVTKQGILMNGAEGEDYSSIPIDKKSVTESYDGNFQRQLVQLQILDNICGQRDRHGNNIFYKSHLVIEKGRQIRRFSRATGIDNDLAFGMNGVLEGVSGPQIGALKKTEKEETDRFKSGYRFRLPIMDEELYYNLMVVSPDMVRGVLHGLIGEEYITAAIDRMEKIKTALRDTNAFYRSANLKFLYKKEEWGEGTLKNIREVIQENEGKREDTSYLQRFVSWRTRATRNRTAQMIERNIADEKKKAIKDREEEFRKLSEQQNGMV